MLNEIYHHAIDGPFTTCGLGVDYQIIEREKANIVAFQGTCFPRDKNLLADILVDLDIVPKRYNKKIYPRGFLEATRSALSAIIGSMPRGWPAKPTYYTGFSLGGAIASIFFGMMGVLENGDRCMTFGAPRTRWGFCRKEPRITHIVIQDDPVPHVAPALWGYYHPGHVASIGKSNAPIFDEDISKCSHMAYDRMTKEWDAKYADA
jgi:hypothetical protein